MSETPGRADMPSNRPSAASGQKQQSAQRLPSLVNLRPDLRQGWLALKRLLFGRRGQQSFSDRLFPSELAGSSNSFGFLTGLSFRRLFVGTPLFHFSENALTLHLLLKNTERLVDVVVPDKYLQLIFLDGAANCGTSCMAANCAGASLRFRGEQRRHSSPISDKPIHFS
jgi:hypothetical protein